MRTLKLKNVLYFPNFNIIGGVETFCYEFGLKYGKDYDITVIFKYGNPKMMRKISEVCRVIRYLPGDKIVCDTFIFGYGHDILDHVEAKEIIQTFHADYVCRHLNPSMDPRITKRFGVAENTTEGIREHFDWAKDIETMYNPYTPKQAKKVLNLVSATRLTAEKGFSRMVMFADELDKAKIPFHWLIFTDVKKDFPNENVTIMGPRYDVLDFIANADYLVQLSDTEGYSYSIVEALSVGTPVIVTDIPVAGEQGVVNGKTGFILSFDMKNIPIQEIYKGVPKFKCKPRESHYETVLSIGMCDCPDFEDFSMVNIRTTKLYYDVEMQRGTQAGEVHQVSRARAEYLVDKGLADYVW